MTGQPCASASASDEPLAFERRRREEDGCRVQHASRIVGPAAQHDVGAEAALVDERLQRVVLGSLAVDVERRTRHLAHDRLERADRVVDPLARREPVEHHDAARVSRREWGDGCRGRHRMRNDHVHGRGAEALLDLRALHRGRPQHGVEALRDGEPPRPQRVERAVRLVRRLEVDGVDGVHQPHLGVVPPDEQLAELTRLADHDDRALGIRAAQLADDVREPGPVQRAEAVEHADAIVPMRP